VLCKLDHAEAEGFLANTLMVVLVSGGGGADVAAVAVANPLANPLATALLCGVSSIVDRRFGALSSSAPTPTPDAAPGCLQYRSDRITSLW
jgi:hypothetical protein